MLRGLFVTGTGTGVGKTVVSAALLHRMTRTANRPVRYWKPVQTGVEQDDDTATVRRLSGCAPGAVLEAGVRLPRPLSPHVAARLAGTRIDLRELTAVARAQPARIRWIVEGAGGVLVPLNERHFMLDLIARLGMPALVVASTRLGTINHTLLTLAALRRRRIGIAGVLMVGPRNDRNRAAIESYGGVAVPGVLPQLRPLTAAALRRWARQDLDSAHELERWFR